MCGTQDRTARALVTLGERDEADGQVLHPPAAEPLTGGSSSRYERGVWIVPEGVGK